MSEKQRTTEHKDGDAVNHPKHYNVHPSGIECIDIIRHLTGNLHSAVKYLWRAGDKDHEGEEKDLRKALWYIEDEIKRQRQKVEAITMTSNVYMGRFVQQLETSGFYSHRDRIIVSILSRSYDLRIARLALHALLNGNDQVIESLIEAELI